MSLRMRWFLVVGGLVALLVVAQGWWVQQLARDLMLEEERVVAGVGQSVAHYFFTGKLNSEQIMAFNANTPGPCSSSPFKSQWSSADGSCEPDGDDASKPDGDGNSEERVQVFDVSFVGVTEPMSDTADGMPREHRQTIQSVVLCEDGECTQRIRGPEGLDERLLSWDEMADMGIEIGGTERRWVTERHRISHGDHEGDDTVFDSRVQLHLQHEGDRRFLTVLGPDSEHRVAIPKSGIRERLDDFLGNVLMGSAGLLAVGLILAGLLAHRVTQPLQRLAAGARRVGEGQWGDQVEVQGSGEVAAAIVAFNHMSQSLAELDARNQELMARQHLSEIGEISRGLAHSLRNPLNALGLSVDELAARESISGGGVDESSSIDGRRELAASARRQIRRIDGSIRSFLALASQGGGVVTAVDLGHLADDVALEALQDTHRSVRLEVERQGDDDLTLQAVEPELRAVVQALVVNAVEASPEAGSVTVRLGHHGDGLLRLTVDDEGPGLPEAVRNRLFTPHLSTKANGSGMGLFLAHRITTTRYGGSLQLEDIPAGGTRVELTLGDRAESREVPPGPTVDLVPAESIP